MKEETVATGAGERFSSWLPLLLFVSSGCVMVIELVAGRILAPLLGVSLYTWTSVIGVVLAGVALGNLVGGRVADASASRLLLGRVFLGSSLGTLSVLVTALEVYRLPVVGPMPLYVLGITLLIFFLPALVLGMVSPLVMKLALDDLATTGRRVGTLHTWAALGSIVGTLATGFLLVSWLGTRTILLGAALLLALVGAAVIEWGALDEREHHGATLAVGLLVMGVVIMHASGYADSLCLRESRYFCINVAEDVGATGERVEILLLDRLRHSMIDPAHPDRLTAGYDNGHIFAALLAMLYPPQEQERLDTLFIGGGGYNFPHYVQSSYAAGAIDVLEIDPAVTRIAEEQFGLERGGRIRTVNQDARIALRQMEPGATYDIIFGDVFNDIAVPYHLTTVEFIGELARHLRPDGLYLLHLIDGREGDFVRATIATLRATFPHVYLIPTDSDWRDTPRTTFVLVASRRPLPLASLTLSGPDNKSWQPLSDEALAGYLSEGRSLLLRDDFAPTDNLLAPVFRDSLTN